MLTTLYQNSFFPATIHLWNDLTQYIRDSPSNCILKSRLKTYYNNPVKPPKYFSFWFTSGKYSTYSFKAKL